MALVGIIHKPGISRLISTLKKNKQLLHEQHDILQLQELHEHDVLFLKGEESR